MDKQDCAICTEKLKLNVGTDALSPHQVEALLQPFGNLKIFLTEICTEAKICFDCYFTPQLHVEEWTKSIRDLHTTLKKAQDPISDVLELFLPEVFSDKNLSISTTTLDCVIGSIIFLIAQYNLPVHSEIANIFERYYALQPEKDATFIRCQLTQGLILGACPVLGISIDGLADVPKSLQQRYPDDRLILSVKSARKGTEVILQAIRLALGQYKIAKSSLNASLVYNSTLVLWRIVAPFFALLDKQDVLEWLFPALLSACEALESIEEPDSEWHVFLYLELMRVSLSYEKNIVKDLPKDLLRKSFKRAIQLTVNEPALYFKVIRSVNSWSETNALLKELIQKEVHGNKLLSSLPKLEKALKASKIDDTAIGVLRETRDLLMPFLENVTVTGKMDPMAELLLVDVFLLAIRCGNFEIADQLQPFFFRSSDTVAVKVMSKLFEAERISVEQGLGDGLLIRSKVEHRMRALTLAKEGILEAIKWNRSYEVEMGCVFAWNLCLPLLQTNLRNELRPAVIKILEVLIASLKSIRSSMRSLQCQLHVELSKLLEHDLLLSKATGHVHLALLNSSVPLMNYRVEQVESLLHRLNIKMNAQNSDRNYSEDKAFLLAEQAKSAALSVVPKLLEQALRMIIPSFQFSDIDLIKNKLVIEKREFKWSDGRNRDLQRRKLCFDVMCTIMTHARRHQCWNLAFEASGFLVDQQWNLEDNSLMICRWQVEANLVRGTCLTQLLGVLVPIAQLQSASADSSALVQLNPFHKLIVEIFFNATKFSQKMTDTKLRDSLNYNVSVYVYNYYVMVHSKEAIQSWQNVFHDLYELISFTQTDFASDTYVSVCELYARSLFASYKPPVVLDQVGEEKNLKKGGAVKSTPLKPVKTADEVAVSFDLIEKVCKNGLRNEAVYIPARLGLYHIYYSMMKAKDGSTKLLECGEQDRSLNILTYLEAIDIKSNDTEVIRLVRQLENDLLDKTNEYPSYLKTELWTRLTKLYLQLPELLDDAFRSSEKALSFSIDSSLEPLEELKKNQIKWRGFAFQYFGEILSQKASNVRGSSEEVDLLIRSLKSFSEATKLASSIKLKSLLITGAEKAYNLLITSKVPKEKVVIYLEVIVDSMLNMYRSELNSDTSYTVDNATMPFVKSLFDVLFNAQTKCGRFDEGSKYIDEALKILPGDSKGFLWQLKVVFLSRSGKGKTEILKILNDANETPEITSKIWYTLAQATEDKEKKNAAFLSAIRSLQDTDITKAEYLIEYGTWLSITEPNAHNALEYLNKAYELTEVSTANLQKRTIQHQIALIRSSVVSAKISANVNCRLKFSSRALAHLHDLVKQTYTAYCKPLQLDSAVKDKKKPAEDSSKLEIAANENFPENLIGWINFDWPVPVRRRVRNDLEEKCVLSKKNLDNSHQLLLSLLQLSDCFIECGSVIECFLLLSTAELISCDIIASNELTAQIQLRFSQLCDSINASQRAFLKKRFAEGSLNVIGLDLESSDEQTVGRNLEIMQILWQQQIRHCLSLADYDQIKAITQDLRMSLRLKPSNTLEAEVKIYELYMAFENGQPLDFVRSIKPLLGEILDVQLWTECVRLMCNVYVSKKQTKIAIEMLEKSDAVLLSIAKNSSFTFQATLGMIELHIFHTKLLVDINNQIAILDKAKNLTRTVGHMQLFRKLCMIKVNLLYVEAEKNGSEARSYLVTALQELELITQGVPDIPINNDIILPEILDSYICLSMKAYVRCKIAEINYLTFKKPSDAPQTIEEKIAQYVKTPVEKKDEDTWMKSVTEQEEFFTKFEAFCTNLKQFPIIRLKAIRSLVRYLILTYKLNIISSNSNSGEALALELQKKVKLFLYEGLCLALSIYDLDAVLELNDIQCNDFISSDASELFLATNMKQVCHSMCRLQIDWEKYLRNNSKEAQLLKRVNFLSSIIYPSISQYSTLVQDKLALASSYTAWIRTHVSIGILDAVQDIPKGCRAITLQHTSDKNKILVSMVSKQPVQTSSDPKKKKTEKVEDSKGGDLTSAAITVDSSLYQNVKNAWADFLNVVRQEELLALKSGSLLAYDQFIKRQTSKRPHLLENDEEHLENPFQRALCAIYQYLKPVFEFLIQAMGPTKEEAPVAAVDLKAKGRPVSAAPTQTPRYYYVLFLDQELRDLPIDVCLPFSDIGSVSRDENLYLFARRSRCVSVAFAEPAAVSSKKKSTTEENKKTEFPNEVLIDLESFAYIADPKCCHISGSGMCPTQLYPTNTIEAAKTNELAVTKWKGRSGPIAHLDPPELQQLVGSRPGFLFYGVDHFLDDDQFPPQLLSSLNLGSVHLSVVLDGPRVELALEDNKSRKGIQPADPASLLTILGSNAVICNRYPTTLAHNQMIFNSLLAGGTEIGKICTPWALGEEISYDDVCTVCYGIPMIKIKK